MLIGPGGPNAPGRTIYTARPLLEWGAVSNADAYHLKVSKKRSDGSWVVVYNTSTTWPDGVWFTSTIPGTLVDGKKYRWKVRSHGYNGWGHWSDRKYFTVDLGNGELPNDKQVYMVRVLRGDDNPNVHWPPPPNRVCVEIPQLALLETGPEEESSWAVAALSPSGASTHRRADDATSSSTASIGGFSLIKPNPAAMPATRGSQRVVGQATAVKEVLFFHNDHLGSPIMV